MAACCHAFNPIHCIPTNILPVFFFFFWLSGSDSEGNWRRDALLFWFLYFLFLHFPLVEIWIPLGWCWCEQLSPRWQTLEIKPRPCFRPGPSKDGRLLCPFHSISLSPFFFIPFSLFLSFSFYCFYTPAVHFHSFFLSPHGVFFSRAKQAFPFLKRDAVHSAVTFSYWINISVVQICSREVLLDWMSGHAEREAEEFCTTAWEVITNGHNLQEGRADKMPCILTKWPSKRGWLPCFQPTVHDLKLPVFMGI